MAWYARQKNSESPKRENLVIQLAPLRLELHSNVLIWFTYKIGTIESYSVCCIGGICSRCQPQNHQHGFQTNPELELPYSILKARIYVPVTANSTTIQDVTAPFRKKSMTSLYQCNEMPHVSSRFKATHEKVACTDNGVMAKRVMIEIASARPVQSGVVASNGRLSSFAI